MNDNDFDPTAEELIGVGQQLARYVGALAAELVKTGALDAEQAHEILNDGDALTAGLLERAAPGSPDRFHVSGRELVDRAVRAAFDGALPPDFRSR
jgi:hypothetical protein